MKEYKRNCPKCNKELIYVNAQSLYGAKKRKTWCYECRKKEVNSRPDFQEKKKIIDNSFKQKFIGDGNPFYGKTHSKKTKDLIRKNTPRKFGKDNPCYNKSVYDWWIENEGKEVADKKLIELKKKISITSSGENNPMYGKPSPQGSGNGWSGWYNGWYFRSLHELSYMVKVIERFHLNWESGEQKKYLMKYVDWEGKQRNYFCDFVIGGKYLVECKPKKLHGSVSVQSKVVGAKKFCHRNGFKYKLISPIMLNDKEMMMLYKTGKIKFLKKYEEKFKKRYL